MSLEEDLLVSGENGTVITDGTTIIGDGLNTPLSAIFNQEGKYIISGGSAWSGTGWVFDVSIIDYFFNKKQKSVLRWIFRTSKKARHARRLILSNFGTLRRCADLR